MPALERAARVRLMGFDVDGVMTDGTLYFTASGDEMKAFSSLDGHGMKMLQSAGVTLAIVTGRKSRALELRAENLGIGILRQGVEDKRSVLREIAGNLGLTLDQAGYMGDDVVDLPVLRACGFSATVADGHPMLRRHVHYVARQSGGHGAVREVCELILRAHGKLDEILAAYLQ